MLEQKIARKEDWIKSREISSPSDVAKLKELLLHLGVELKELSPSDNGDGCVINIIGQEHLIDGLKVILKQWINQAEEKNVTKEDWIFSIKRISHPAHRARLEELLAILDVELKKILHSKNGKNKCMINVIGRRHLIEGLKIILKPGITF